MHPQQCDTKTATNPSLTQSGVAVIVDSEEVCSGIPEFYLNAPSDSFPLRGTMAVRSVPRNTVVVLSAAQRYVPLITLHFILFKKQHSQWSDGRHSPMNCLSLVDT